MSAPANVEDSEELGLAVPGDLGVLPDEGDRFLDDRQAVAVAIGPGQRVGAVLRQLEHAALVAVGVNDRLDQLVGLAGHLLSVLLPGALLALLTVPVSPVVGFPVALAARASVVGCLLVVRGDLSGVPGQVPGAGSGPGETNRGDADHAGDAAGEPEFASSFRRSLRAGGVVWILVVGHWSSLPSPHTRQGRLARERVSLLQIGCSSQKHRMGIILTSRSFAKEAHIRPAPGWIGTSSTTLRLQAYLGLLRPYPAGGARSMWWCTQG